MKLPYKELTLKQREAAHLIGYGATIKEAAEHCGVNYASVYKWHTMPEFAALSSKECDKYLATLKSKAAKKLEQQLDGGGTWLIADAIKMVHNRSDKLEGITEGRITVSFEGSIAVPGVPDTSPDDVQDGQDDDDVTST